MTPINDNYVLDEKEYLMFVELAYGPLRRGDTIYVL